MIKPDKLLVAVLAVTFLFMAQSGCVKKGPVQRTGEKIDKTVDKTGKKVGEVFK